MKLLRSRGVRRQRGIRQGLSPRELTAKAREIKHMLREVHGHVKTLRATNKTPWNFQKKRESLLGWTPGKSLRIESYTRKTFKRQKEFRLLRWGGGCSRQQEQCRRPQTWGRTGRLSREKEIPGATSAEGICPSSQSTFLFGVIRMI